MADADALRPVPVRWGRVKPWSRYGVIRFFQHLTTAAIVLALSMACYFVISRFFVESVQVVGSSMVPTLQENGHYVLNRWAFHDRAPARGEVVVIIDPGDHGYSVKRVIGLPGETVHFKDGKVYVNDDVLPEPYLLPNTHTFTYSKEKEQMIALGPDQFFVLGDNRLVSIDSRAYGPVTRDGILGKVVLK
jgi:signal peptidase I